MAKVPTLNPFNAFFVPFFDEWDEFSSINKYVPPVNFYDGGNNYIVEVALPGFKEDEVEISLQNRILTITGKKKEKNEEKDKQFFRKEIRYSSFTRSITLPEDVELDNCKASFDNGILKVVMPKSPKSQPRTIKINAK